MNGLLLDVHQVPSHAADAGCCKIGCCLWPAEHAADPDQCHHGPQPGERAAAATALNTFNPGQLSAETGSHKPQLVCCRWCSFKLATDGCRQRCSLICCSVLWQSMQAGAFSHQSSHQQQHPAVQAQQLARRGVSFRLVAWLTLPVVFDLSVNCCGCRCWQFLARPFVPGDSVTLGSAGTGLTGIVEAITPMRTTLRTEDDILVTVPNKVTAEIGNGRCFFA